MATNPEAREEGGSEIRRPRGRTGGKLAYFMRGLAIGSLLGAGVYSAIAPRSSNATYCSVNQSVTLTGAGATFPFPLVDKWRVEYNRQCPNVQINYQSIGSGGGIAQINAGARDLWAGAAPPEAPPPAGGRR